MRPLKISIRDIMSDEEVVELQDLLTEGPEEVGVENDVVQGRSR